ncbi:MAG: 16S rRNA (cytosine(1402)-N(4))-methyltransferase RsmH, partial [Alphaproteobacteria bacterium]|nr:16S rRNA (cytosine(1402)-N(4))-methyltransferase RsmH [Alphaproteobacteria bacterium]
MSHIPVMLPEVLAHLRPTPGETHLDGTFGGGGYAAAILETGATLYALDRDPAAIARGAALLARFPGRLHLLHARFGEMLDAMAEQGVSALDGVVLDLGVSSFQIDQPERGFSFRADGPLDMRMGREGPTAADLVNTLPERELADLLWELGEERHSRRVARAIIAARPFATTLELANIVRRSIPRDPSGLDSATRSFQALRIKVNDELG